MRTYKEVVPGTIPTKNLHQYLLSAVGPRPIAFASTIDRAGNPNLAPFSFFNVFSAKPPILIFSPARRVRNNTTKHTLANVYEVPEVVVNVVNYDIVEQMNLASAEFGEDVSEFTKAGLTPLDSDLVAPFRVKESPVQMECKVVEIKPLANTGGAGQLIFAEVVKMHIHHQVLDDNGMIDTQKIDLVARMGKMWYCRANGEALFEVNKPGLGAPMGVDQMPDIIKLSPILTGNNLGKLGMIEHLPSEEVVREFYDTEANGILCNVTSVSDLHHAANEVLDQNGDYEFAWKILLCGKYISKDAE